MKLKHRWYPGEKSVSDAVEAAVDGSDYDRGSVETAAATADNAAKMLGQLIERLFEKGVLSPTDIVALLPDFVVVEEVA